MNIPDDVEKITFPTPWRKSFCLIPREVEGVMVWLEYIEIRETACHSSMDGLIYTRVQRHGRS